MAKFKLAYEVRGVKLKGTVEAPDLNAALDAVTNASVQPVTARKPRASKTQEAK